jgi:hypothetical protein
MRSVSGRRKKADKRADSNLNKEYGTHAFLELSMPLIIAT